MKVMCMTAIGTMDEERHYYVLVKDSFVEKPLNEIMEKIGYGVLYYGEEEGDSPIHAENRVDHVVAGKYDIDIVYTQNRIVLIVRAPKNNKKFLRNLCLVIAKWTSNVVKW